ncbi:hypothetical protein GUJ93_ZPchr0006g45440 [Zizania palustris]|uniref:Uncharacterized protein n=1 Tax=Zizania palustris TaxID=103762 RepID=A0A8J5TD76_ZIZPA|nr:hypothetical protein GUJ93_ZPchr0006g45440 [Zizania palustris]
MEAKGLAVAAACCMFILLLSGRQQQVAAVSKISRCYLECLPNCGQHGKTRSFCKMFCGFCCVFNDYRNCTSTAAAAAPFSGHDCKMICLTSFCGGTAATTCGERHFHFLKFFI